MGLIHNMYFYSAVNQSIDLGAKSIEAALGNQVLLNYFLSGETLFILFVSEEESELIEVSVPDNFAQMVAIFVDSIKLMNAKEFNATAHQLCQILIHPVADLVFDIFASEALQDIVIIPHSYLAQIPFEALLDSPLVKGSKPDYL